jgi:hypothetical protein
MVCIWVAFEHGWLHTWDLVHDAFGRSIELARDTSAWHDYRSSPESHSIINIVPDIQRVLDLLSSSCRLNITLLDCHQHLAASPSYNSFLPTSPVSTSYFLAIIWGFDSVFRITDDLLFLILPRDLGSPATRLALLKHWTDSFETIVVFQVRDREVVISTRKAICMLLTVNVSLDLCMHPVQYLTPVFAI